MRQKSTQHTGRTQPPLYWLVLAQLPIRTPPWLSATIMVDLSLQNPHCDSLSQFTESLEPPQHTDPLH